MTELVTNPDVTGSSVLERFATLRAGILSVVEDGRKVTGSLGAFSRDFEQRINLVEAAVNAGRLNLVVIGGEGTGKSTFVNMVLGREISAQREQNPGTVAPIFIEQGIDTEPCFSVKIDGEKGPRACRDQDEFDAFLLQEYNPSNSKNVICGWVQLNHPLLRDGLRLVDMPGTEGVSAAIAQQAEKFLMENAHSVVAVQKVRDYGPLARALDRLSRHELEIDAVVSNQFSDFWFGVDDEVALARKVDGQRAHTIEAMALERPDLPIDPTDVFVVSLASMRGQGGRLLVRSLVQDQEANGLRARVWERCRERGFGRVVLDGVDEAGKALALAEAHLQTRHTLIETITTGGASVAHIATELAAARTVAASEWGVRVDPRVVRAVAAKEWSALRTAIIDGKETVLDQIGILQKRLSEGPDSSGRLSKSAAAAIHDELASVTRPAFTGIETEHQRVLEELGTRYLTVANDLLDAVHDAVPALRNPDVGHTQLDVQQLVAFTLDRVDDNSTGNWLTALGVGAVGTAGGMLAGGQGIAVLVGVATLGPIGALLVGGVLAGALGGLTVDLLRRGHRASVRTRLAATRRAVEAIDTSTSGAMFEEWCRAVDGLANGIGRLLTDRLDILEAAVRDPAAGGATLAGELEAIRASQAELRRLDARLTAIGHRAGES